MPQCRRLQENPEIWQLETWDVMRGNPQDKIILWFNPNDLVALPCHCNYDPILNQETQLYQNHVMIVRKIEFQTKDGSWQPYPSVSWLDEAMFLEQLQTFAFVKKKGKEGFDIMSSHQGVPDAELMIAAQEAGVHTEKLG